MRTLYVTKGLPGSGKSTWANELLKKEPDRWRRVNRDQLRLMLTGDAPWTPQSEELVKKLQDDVIRSAVKDGYDVIVDNTHLVPSTLRKLHKLAESIGDIKVLEKAFNVPIAECHRRNQLRQGSARVPDKVIDDMASRAGITKGRKLEDAEAYYQPRWLPGGPGADPVTVQQDQNLPKAIICDLDGTLALMNGRNPYDASTCDKDLPNVPVIECVKAMHAQGYRILFMSGREDKYREPTIRFIEQHCTHEVDRWATNPNVLGAEWVTKPIPYELHMRTTGDTRKDSIIKEELFAAHVAGKYNVVFVLDDRDQVVEQWRRMGLTVFQVAPGAF